MCSSVRNVAASEKLDSGDILTKLRANNRMQTHNEFSKRNQDRGVDNAILCPFQDLPSTCMVAAH